MRRTLAWIRNICPSHSEAGATIGPPIEVWRQSSPADWRTGAAGASSTARRRPSRWHRLCDAISRRCVAMKPALTAAALLLLAGPAMAAPGDPRAVRGNLEWPAVLSAEPFIVVRGDDGRLYYADVARARRTTPGPIAGATPSVGLHGNQPHDIGAAVV